MVVQCNVRVVFSVTTISPRLGRPERPLRASDQRTPAMQRPHSRANPPSGVLPDQLLGWSRSPPINRSRFPVASIRVLLIFSIALARLCEETGPHHLLPLSCQLSQHCSRAWAIRQLTVEGAIRRRICHYQHGLSYARSATMMDDTLIIVLLEP